MIDKLKQMIHAHTIRKGACGHGIREIVSAKNLDDLIQLLLMPDSVSHCAEFQFPPIEMMLPYESQIRPHNIFLSGRNTATNAGITLIFGGHAELHFDSYTVSEVYVTNDASVTINAKDNAYVMVCSYHQAQVLINQTDQSRVKEVKHV